MGAGTWVIFVTLHRLVNHRVALVFALRKHSLRSLRLHVGVHTVVRGWRNEFCGYFLPKERWAGEVLFAWRFVPGRLDAAFCLRVGLCVVVSLLRAHPLGVRQEIDSFRLKTEACRVPLVHLREVWLKCPWGRPFISLFKTCNFICHSLPLRLVNVAFLFRHEVASDFIVGARDILFVSNFVVNISRSFACVDLGDQRLIEFTSGP